MCVDVLEHETDRVRAEFARQVLQPAHEPVGADHLHTVGPGRRSIVTVAALAFEVLVAVVDHHDDGVAGHRHAARPGQQLRGEFGGDTRGRQLMAMVVRPGTRWRTVARQAERQRACMAEFEHEHAARADHDGTPHARHVQLAPAGRQQFGDGRSPVGQLARDEIGGTRSTGHGTFIGSSRRVLEEHSA